MADGKKIVESMSGLGHGQLMRNAFYRKVYAKRLRLEDKVRGLNRKLGRDIEEGIPTEGLFL